MKERLQKYFKKIKLGAVNFKRKFKSASLHTRWLMLRKPIILLILLIVVLLLAPVFAPPRIMTSFPGSGDSEAPLDSKIEIIFSRGVIKSQAEAAFRVSPQLVGSFSWEGDQKLIFAPKPGLTRGKKYKIEMAGLVLSKFLVPLVGSRRVEFETIGNPKIVLAAPQAEALEDLTPITVIFDRPMIPLTTATNSAAAADAFTIDPKIEGEGRWLGTTAYQFRPSEKIRRATTYKVVVPAGLGAVDGGKIQDDYIFDFSSLRPKVDAVSPLAEYLFASPTASVSAKFNQNIDPASARQNFTVYDSNKKRVAGEVSVSGSEIGFYPSAPLSRGGRYTAVVKSGLKGSEGPNGIEADYSWNFAVAASPAVLFTTPSGGSYDVREERRIEVVFKTPMDEKSFEDNLTIDPKPETKPQLYFSSYSGRNSLSINTYLAVSKEYTITIGSGVSDQYGTPLGQPYTFKFKTASSKPSISINPARTFFGAFNQQIVPRVVVTVVNSKSVNYSLYKLKKEDLLSLYRRRYGNECGQDASLSCANWQNYKTDKLEKVRSWNETFKLDSNVPTEVVTKITLSGGGKIPPGAYFLEANIVSGSHDNMVLIVSKSALTVKKSDKQIFVWATDQSTGNVVPGLNIELTDIFGNILTTGVTNKDGVFMKEADLFQRNQLFVFGSANNEFVAAATDWNEGIDLYNFGLPSHYLGGEGKDYLAKQNYKIFITLDRPIYRPGQKVYFKGVIRKDNDGAYENLKAGEKINVVISDTQNRPVYQKDLPLSSFGSFSSEFVLSKNAPLGDYKVGSTFSGNSFNLQFQVEEYKKPEVAVDVKSSKTTYVQAEVANININSSYYFGAPVANRPVSWVEQTQDFSFVWDKDWRYEFGDPDSYWSRTWWDSNGSGSFSGKKVTEGKGTTDSRGDLELSLPLDIGKYKGSQRMIVEATIEDANNQSVAASGEFTVHKAQIYAGLRPLSYSNQSGKEAKVDVVSVDLNGTEIPGVPVSVDFYKRTWVSIREKNADDGLFYYVSKPSDARASSTIVTTDSLGRVTAAFTPEEGGTYKVVAHVTDKNGNQNTTGSFIWVSGYGFSAPRENNDRIPLVTDKRDYMVGENISVFVASPFGDQPAKTLLTAERGSVLDYKIVDTGATSNNFKLSTLPNFSPNVFIGAVVVRGGDQVQKPPEFKIGYSEAKVTDKKQQMDVKITTNKKKYSPGENLTATIETKDLLGHSAPAEVAVSLVDKSVWDLARAQLPDIYKSFYNPRNLEVSTSELLTISIDRINANTNLGSKGGGGGGGGDGGNDTSRRNFPDTSYWNPSITTDKNGRAEISIKLPDSLTTWRLAAIANSQEASFGSAVSEFKVSRDVLIRPFLPRFISTGDEAALGAIVVNNTAEVQKIKVKIEASGIKIIDEETKEEILGPGEQKKFIWSTLAKVGKLARIKLSAAAENKTLKDAVEISIPIKSYSFPETVAVSGQALDTKEETILLPKDIEGREGEANLTWSSSLGTAGIEGLQYLFTYPYYCVEQITSRMMPAIFVNRILTQAKLSKTGSVNSHELDSVINDGIQRLNSQQHPDGGWGWWIEYESDPFLSSYAFEALTEAKKDGFTVAEKTLTGAADFLESKLVRPDERVGLNNQAYFLYVLREKNKNLGAFASNLFDRRFELSLEARAYLAMAMKNMPGQSGKAKKLMDEIISVAKKTATTTHWEESRQEFGFMGGNTTATAAILEALVTLDSKNPLIAEVVRYLINERIDNHWATTRETAASIKAISSQLIKNGDQNLDETYRLLLNGKIFKEGKFTKEDLLRLEETTISIDKFKIGANNKLKIQKSGQGNFYYNLNLKYYLPFSETKPLERGMVVVREFVDSQGKILPVDSLPENSEVWVRLIIVAPEERRFVVIEDALPAGLESVNESLKNVSILNKYGPPPKEKDNRILYFDHREYHDDKTTLFAQFLPAGVYEFSYRVRSTTPGRFHYPPAQAYQMYTPDVSGHSAGGWLEIK